MKLSPRELIRFLSIAVLVLTLGCRPRLSNDSTVKETAKTNSSLLDFGGKVVMTMDRLKSTAFAVCQTPFGKPQVSAVPQLDPPRDGNDASIGMTFVEANEVKRKYDMVSNGGMVFKTLARAGLNQMPAAIYSDQNLDGTYEYDNWSPDKVDYSDPLIVPPVDVGSLPEAGKYWTGIYAMRGIERGGQTYYPIAFDIRSNSYIRFVGVDQPSLPMGASLRVFARQLFGVKANTKKNRLYTSEDFGVREDFPYISHFFVSTPTNQDGKVLALVISEKFCGAVDLTVRVPPLPAQGASMTELIIDGFWYARSDFNWREDPNTGFVAYSSMYWKNEDDTPSATDDEAHDSEYLIVETDKGIKEHKISIPDRGQLRLSEFPAGSAKEVVKGWAIEKRDRDPSHYSRYGSAQYHMRLSHRVEIMESSVKTAVRFYENFTESEYDDNLVSASVIREDIKKSTGSDDFVRFKYKTSVYW